MGQHQMQEYLRLAQMTGEGKAFYVPSVSGHMLAWGTTVPSAVAGYAPGCIFIHTDGAAGTLWYVNEGTATSCTFSAVAALTAAQEALLSATAGTAAASKAVILDASAAIDAVKTAALHIGTSGAETEVTATGAELNYVDVTAGVATASKALVLDASGHLASGTVIMDDMTPGTGISAVANAVCEHSVTKVGGLYKTEIVIDLTDLVSKNTANDIIGKDDTANCHFGQITAAKNGTIVAGRMTCLETPATGDDDLDLYSATEGTGAEDAQISTLTETQLLNSGNWTAGTVKVLTAVPAADEYLYLVAGTGDLAAAYTAGKFLIELWGK